MDHKNNKGGDSISKQENTTHPIKQSVEAPAAVKEAISIKPEVPVPIPADCSSNHEQQKKSTAKGANVEARFVQELRLKLQEQVLQKDDKMEYKEDTSDEPLNTSYNPPGFTSDSHQDDSSEQSRTKDAHDSNSCEEPQAVATESNLPSATKQGDQIPTCESDSLQQQVVQEIPGHSYLTSKSTRTVRFGPLPDTHMGRGNQSSEGKSNSNLRGTENYRGQGEREYNQFWKFYKSHKKNPFKKVKEIKKDLFKMPPEYALAHCVAEDMAMGSGIAVQFSQQFKSRDELYQQRQKQGGLAVLSIEGRFIYYLVTKKRSNEKPTMHTMWCSLRKLQHHMEDNKVVKLAIPRIGCGLDRLEWSEVKAMIEYVFRNSDVEITVCNFQQSSPSAHKGPRKCVVRNVARPLVQIEEGAAIIYFGTEEGFVSEGIESLDTKFGVVKDYKIAKRTVGEVVLNYKNDGSYALYGFIVNKQKEDPFDFINLQKCLIHLEKHNRRDKYGYIAFEAFLDEDDLIISKICNVLRNFLYDVEVYVYWPPEMAHLMPKERQYRYY